MSSPYDTDEPIEVLVTEGRYDVVDEPTPRKLMLMQILKDMGGVADSVPPGSYHFNVTAVDGKWIATLVPA